MTISADTFAFLQELSANNNREWFAEQKPRFQTIQANLLDFTGDLLQQLAHLDERMLDIAPKNCLFRIYKDARFSKDKSPYKTHFGIHMVTSGDRADFGRAGFYLHIEPSGSFLAGGAHAPTPEWLKRIRANLAEDGDKFTKLTQQADFKKTFGHIEGTQLVRNPVGYPADHAQIEWLKYKTMTVSHALSDKEVLSPKFTTKCLQVFAVYKPFRDFLNRP